MYVSARSNHGISSSWISTCVTPRYCICMILSEFLNQLGVFFFYFRPGTQTFFNPTSFVLPSLIFSPNLPRAHHSF